MSKVLVIAGMHRSGTSLLSRYFSESGVYMGCDEKNGQWNPQGHYEDLEFLHLHRTILKSHHLNFTVTSPVTWNITDTIRDRARSLISTRSSHGQWGWKDPRTCLFLPFWKDLIPECHFAVIYRSFLPVIRSLISRDMSVHLLRTNRWQRIREDHFNDEEIRRLSNLYLRTWIWYNREIKRHILNDPMTKYAMLSFEQLTGNDFSSLETLRHFGFHLQPPTMFNPNPSKSNAIEDLKVECDVDLLKKAMDLDGYFTSQLSRK